MYILDIRSRKTGGDLNQGASFISGRLRFDGSDEDKIELLRICRASASVLTHKVQSVNYAKDKDESYTDGKSIIISSEVDVNMDATLGLTLHEASHIAITSFNFLKTMVKRLTADPNSRLAQDVHLIKDLLNWVEDRRIDNWAYNKAIGYKKYYEALYRRYFLSEHVENLCERRANSAPNSQLRKETIDNYMFYIINSINPCVNMDELFGLPEIKELIDIENIGRLKNTREAYDVAYGIYEVILKYVAEDDKMTRGGKNKAEGLSGQELSDMINSMTDEELADMVSSLNGKSSDFGDHKIDNSEVVRLDEKASKRLEEAMAKLEEKKFEETKHTKEDSPIKSDVKRDFAVKMITKISDSTILNGTDFSIFTSRTDGNAPFIKRGRNLSKTLKSKLQFRTEKRETKYINQKYGKINVGKIHTCAIEPEKIFFSKLQSKYEDLNIHLSIDASGSMQGNKWAETLVLVSAICYATSGMDGIRTQVSFRYSDSGDVCLMFYDSLFNTEKRIGMLAHVSPTGGTPEGVCYSALCTKVLDNLLDKNTLFINFSDGEPNGELAVEVTEKMVRFFKRKGMSIVSYFITDYETALSSTFTRMYGKDSALVKSGEMNALAKTLNKRFLTIGKG